MKYFLKIVLQILVLFGALDTSVVADSPNPKGVILVVIDDIGYGDIGCLHDSDLETPAIDKICSESLRLTDFHVGTTCAPTRASLMTGRYINAGGVWHTIAGREILRAKEKTMADVFKANKWATGIFGKWHLGEGYPFSPRFRGFEEAMIHGGGGVSQSADYWGNDYYSGQDFDGQETIDDVYFQNGEQIKSDRFCTDFWFNEAKRFIKKSVSNNQPFFCYLPTNAAHSPFNAPHGFKKGFDGLIENVDSNMKSLDQFLNELKIQDDTLLIFTSDNGTAGPRSGGLRGKKGSHYDGGHNVPCFWRWKNGGMAGMKETSRDIVPLCAAMDLLPTFVDLFHLNDSELKLPIHGISLKKMLTDENFVPTDRTLVVDTQRLRSLVKWKNLCVMEDQVEGGRITHKWRLIRESVDHDFEIYDFLQDRDTDDDLLESQENRMAALSKSYESWWSQISSGGDDYPAFVVGTEFEKELRLNPDTFIGRDNSPWHQRQVLAATEGTGKHSVKFSHAGKYRFELRRWPREDGGLIVAKSASGKGKSIEIAKARLTIEGVSEKTKAIQDKDAFAVFEIDIAKPITCDVTALFLDENGNEITGVYYTYIRKLPN